MELPRFALEDWFARYKANCRYNLGSSDVEGLGMHELVTGADDEVLSLWNSATLGYGQSRGHPLLRAQIADGYTAVDAEHVHVFSGATEAVFATINVLLGPGDHAIVVGPIYQLLADLPIAAGASVTRVDLQMNQDWALDLDTVRDAITPATRVIVTNFPNNPTGALPSGPRFQELVDLAAESGVVLLCDELYRGLEVDGSTRLPAGVDLGDHVVSIAGTSKIYGLAGIRVGWAATTDDRLLDRLRTYRYWTSLSGSVPSELLALTALRQSDRLLNRAQSIVSRNRDLLAAFVADHRSDISCVPPGAGTTAFPRLLNGSALDLATRLVEQHSTFLVPAPVLGASGEHLRIGLGRNGFGDALKHVAQALAG